MTHRTRTQGGPDARRILSLILGRVFVPKIINKTFTCEGHHWTVTARPCKVNSWFPAVSIYDMRHVLECAVVCRHPSQRLLQSRTQHVDGTFVTFRPLPAVVNQMLSNHPTPFTYYVCPLCILFTCIPLIQLYQCMFANPKGNHGGDSFTF